MVGNTHTTDGTTMRLIECNQRSQQASTVYSFNNLGIIIPLNVEKLQVLDMVLCYLVGNHLHSTVLTVSLGDVLLG